MLKNINKIYWEFLKKFSRNIFLRFFFMENFSDFFFFLIFLNKNSKVSNFKKIFEKIKNYGFFGKNIIKIYDYIK